MTPLPYWSFLNTKTEKSTIKNNELDDFKNPTPNSNKMELNTLPVLDNVFFVHYTCGNFNEYRNPAETPITGLFLYDRQSRDFVPNEEKDELRCILEYLGCFNDNQGNGLTPVHWGQKKSYWGFAHLIDRVSFLTKKLSNGGVTPLYTPDFPHDTIDLSEYLFNRYGDKYIEHPRLDNLASLNGFNGIRETNPTNITYSGSTRLMLLVKIYEAERTGELKTRPTTTPQNIGVERGNGVPNYISLTTQQITDSYELFKETALSNTNISDYFKCWDLNEPNPPEIVFGHNFATQFHYFLSKIEGVNAELALKRFGINNFNQVKNKHNPEPNLKNEIGRILEKKNIVKVN